MLVAPNTTERAKKLAKTLKSILSESYAVEVPLSSCHEAIAAGCGQDGWFSCSKALKRGQRTTWTPDRAEERLRSHDGVAQPVARAAVAELGTHMRPRPGKAEKDADAIFSTAYARDCKLTGWRGKMARAMATNGFSDIVRAIIAAAVADPGRFIGENVAVVRGSYPDIPAEGDELVDYMRGQISVLASRPRHPAWPVLCLFAIHRFAERSSNYDKLMKEDVWDEVMMSFIPVLSSLEKADPENLAAALWRLPDGIRNSLPAQVGQRIMLVLSYFFGAVAKAGQERYDWPGLAKMADRDGEDTPVIDPPAAPPGEGPFSREHARWTMLGGGDLTMYVGMPDEELPPLVWARSLVSGREAGPLLAAFGEAFAAKASRLGVFERQATSVTVVGFGPDPANVHPAAALLVRKKVQEDDDSDDILHYVVDLDDAAYAPGIESGKIDPVLVGALAHEMSADLRRLRWTGIPDEPAGSAGQPEYGDLAPVGVNCYANDVSLEGLEEMILDAIDVMVDYARDDDVPRGLFRDPG